MTTAAQVARRGEEGTTVAAASDVHVPPPGLKPGDVTRSSFAEDVYAVLVHVGVCIAWLATHCIAHTEPISPEGRAAIVCVPLGLLLVERALLLSMGPHGRGAWRYTVFLATPANTVALAAHLFLCIALPQDLHSKRMYAAVVVGTYVGVWVSAYLARTVALCVWVAGRYLRRRERGRAAMAEHDAHTQALVDTLDV